MSTPRILSDRAEWDAGCSVIVAAQIGDGVARKAPEAQERVAPEQYHLDCLHLDTDAGLQSTSEMSWFISFHAHETHCGLLVGRQVTVQKAPILVNHEMGFFAQPPKIVG